MHDIVQLFSVNASLVELAVRGTALYLLLFVLLRFVVPRDLDTIGLVDLMVLVLLADAAQNAISGDSISLTESGIVLLVIAGWRHVFDRLAHRHHRHAGAKRGAGPV